MSSGKGSFKIRLVNVRTPYVFALLKGGEYNLQYKNNIVLILKCKRVSRTIIFMFYYINSLVLYSIGFDAPSLVATSKQVTFSSPNEPLQPHLALTNDPTTLLYVYHYIITFSSLFLQVDMEH